MNAMRTAVAPARQADGLKNELFLLTVMRPAEGLDSDGEERFAHLAGRLALADDRFAEAGMTADRVGRWLLGETDPRAWEAVLPSMGYADRLSRLHELDACGLSREAVRRLGEELADPARIARERIRPLTVYEAARQTPSRAWAAARAWTAPLERALRTSLTNVPSLPGRTLILIDRSVSMFTQVARGSAVTVADRAAVFGAALALRAEDADLVQFGTSHRQVEFAPTSRCRRSSNASGSSATATAGDTSSPGSRTRRSTSSPSSRPPTAANGPSERSTDPPLRRSQLVGQGITAAVLTVAALASAVLVISQVIRLLLDRLRMAGWEADWSIVEPRWTGRWPRR
jgi:hypothetical protein